MRKVDLSKYFPYDAEVIASMEKKVAPNTDLLPLNGEIMKLSESLFPVSEETGAPENMVQKLLSPNVSALEKERIARFLEKMPPSKRNGLSDEDLVRLLPSRYNSTLTDNDKVAEYMKDFADESFENDKVAQQIDEQQGQNEPSFGSSD